MAWVLEQIERIAQFGQGRSGITRLAFSKADHEARNYIIELMQAEDLTVHIDAVGNIIGRFEPEGIQADAPAVITGSHLDTVPSGGKYDGALGVVCGLAAVSRLKERSGLEYPLEVVVFAAEESSRFNFATIGSKAMAGLANVSAWMRAQDQDGISFSSELAAIGRPIENVGSAARPKNSIRGFLELHIEQGRVLEQEKISIGIVDKIAAPTRLKITVVGTAGHSGAVPIEERQDALVSASMIVLAVRDIATEYTYQSAVATVTILKTYPGAINVIPGQVEMWVDIRGTDHESVIGMIQEIKDAISTIADDNDTPVSIEVLFSDKPVKLDETIIETVESACQQLKIPSLRLDSLAGHDTMNMAHIAPAGLIFIPCKQGVSHNGNEYAAPDDIAAGLDVLTEALYQLAKCK
ncbi:Zn-dependent hydrolase [Sporomusa carbonis]|uniref:Zn-dependent hydrolase n=1 Tax=Sporomusa carbonis TaxID=3076075 RepID=UPI003C7B908F